MLKLTKTGIGLLTRQYRSVLKKCWAINVGVFGLMGKAAASVAKGAADTIGGALNGYGINVMAYMLNLLDGLLNIKSNAFDEQSAKAPATELPFGAPTVAGTLSAFGVNVMDSILLNLQSKKFVTLKALPNVLVAKGAELRSEILDLRSRMTGDDSFGLTKALPVAVVAATVAFYATPACSYELSSGYYNMRALFLANVPENSKDTLSQGAYSEFFAVGGTDKLNQVTFLNNLNPDYNHRYYDRYQYSSVDDVLSDMSSYYSGYLLSDTYVIEDMIHGYAGGQTRLYIDYDIFKNSLTGSEKALFNYLETKNKVGWRNYSVVDYSTGNSISKKVLTVGGSAVIRGYFQGEHDGIRFQESDSTTTLNMDEGEFLADYYNALANANAGGANYTEGTGISIANNTISLDSNYLNNNYYTLVIKSCFFLEFS